jgi:hypothetical protein
MFWALLAFACMITAAVIGITIAFSAERFFKRPASI